MLSDESEVLLAGNKSHRSIDSGAPSSPLSATFSRTGEPPTTSAVLNCSSSSGQRPFLAAAAADTTMSTEDISMQSPYRSASPITGESDVDVGSSPLSSVSTAEYFAAAEAVSDASDNYRQCETNVKPLAASHFDTLPADIVLDSGDGEPHGNEYSLTSVQDSGKSARSNKCEDEVDASSSSLRCEDDPYCSVAGQHSSLNSSHKSSDLPSLYMTSAAVATPDEASGMEAADVVDCYSQSPTVELVGTKDITGARSIANGSEISDSDDSASVQAALDSSSSDPAYARASVSQMRFPAECYASAAPLSPDYGAPHSIS